MKKIAALVLVVLTIAALMVPCFAAAATAEGSKSINPTATIKGKSTKGVTIDGKIGEYEYEAISYTADNMRYYSASDEAHLATVKGYTFKMYACWDTAKLYLAVQVSTPNFSQTKAASSMYLEESCQVSCAKVDEKTAATRNEYGFSKT